MPRKKRRKIETRALKINTRSVVRAEYIEPELPAYKGNPLILALPSMNDPKTAAKRLRYSLPYEESMRQLPAHIRTHQAMDMLRFFEPLRIHLKLEAMLSRAIRDGYISRNPLDPANAKSLKARLDYYTIPEHLYRNHFAPTAAGFMILGTSGVGKTTGVGRVLSLYPQLIIHSKFEHRRFTKIQFVWLIVECPKDGSTKQLCVHFFKALDYLMGDSTTYLEDYGKDAYATDEMLDSMAELAASHHLGVLVIDEIQCLDRASSGGADEMLYFFVSLVNRIGVPVILIGNEEAQDLVTRTFRQARRSSGQGDLIWEAMPFDDTWNFYVEALWEYQYVRTPTPLTPELSKALHETSWGITDIANRVLLSAQVRAIENAMLTPGCEDEVITEGLIRSAFRDDFRLVSYVQELIKAGSPSLARLVKDARKLPILPVSSLPDLPSGSTPSIEATSAGGSNSDDGGSATTSNTDMDLSPEVEPKDTNLQKQNWPPIESLQADGHPSRRRRRVKTTTFVDPHDLRGIVARGYNSSPAQTAYDALLKAGVINPSSEFFH